MWGLSRGVLDQTLLNAAAEAGVRVLQPHRCEGVLPADEDGICVRVRDMVSNSIEVLRSGWVIAADGKSLFSSVDESTDCTTNLSGRTRATLRALTRKTRSGSKASPPNKRATPSPTDDFGIKTHFADIDGPRDAIELFSTTGTYGGLAPIESGRWNAAFSVRSEMLRESAGDLDAVFDRLVRGNSILAVRLLRCAGLVAGLHRRCRVSRCGGTGLPHVVPVGNAAAALEPIGGEGMGLALRSAELAAEALDCEDDFSASSLARAYGNLWPSPGRVSGGSEARFVCRGFGTRRRGVAPR